MGGEGGEGGCMKSELSSPEIFCCLLWADLKVDCCSSYWSKALAAASAPPPPPPPPTCPPPPPPSPPQDAIAIYAMHNCCILHSAKTSTDLCCTALQLQRLMQYNSAIEMLKNSFQDSTVDDTSGATFQWILRDWGQKMPPRNPLSASKHFVWMFWTLSYLQSQILTHVFWIWSCPWVEVIITNI